MDKKTDVELEGKTALITGAGAPGGIGAATAELLAAEGAKIIITGRDADRGQTAVRVLHDAGANARFVLADMTELDDVARLADEASDVDILVNNAAAFTLGPTVGQAVDGLEESLAANIRGPYLLVAAVAPRMLAKGSGSIINISSLAARVGMPGMSVYGATKAALESLTRTWAAEFAEGGVRVNAIQPGPTASQNVMALIGEQVQQLALTLPLARVATTHEIAQTILFLASERSSYITGATIPVDGGRTAI
jgi:NAD(P)-dependent dehydrogenase (short-subunit alcohol dehydrogenase family)